MSDMGGATSGLHPGETPIGDDLVRRLVDTQLPQWRDRPLRRLPPVGTDNQLFRLGDDLLLRLPRIHWAADAAEREAAWLPRLAPDLPLDVPVPLVLGEPDGDYPYHWTVVPWLAGDAVADVRLEPDGWDRLAADVGAFLAVLRGLDATGGPVKADGERGAPLADCDDWVREWTERAAGQVDAPAVLAAWEESLAAPPWPGSPAWLHGDAHGGNLLVADGRVSAVIDWGAFGIGDPAVELNQAWGDLPPRAVPAYRAALGLDAVDPHAWLRGRGWALVPSISALTYYAETAPHRAVEALATLDRILADAQAG